MKIHSIRKWSTITLRTPSISSSQGRTRRPSSNIAQNSPAHPPNSRIIISPLSTPTDPTRFDRITNQANTSHKHTRARTLTFSFFCTIFYSFTLLSKHILNQGWWVMAKLERRKSLPFITLQWTKTSITSEFIFFKRFHAETDKSYACSSSNRSIGRLFSDLFGVLIIKL